MWWCLRGGAPRVPGTRRAQQDVSLGVHCGSYREVLSRSPRPLTMPRMPRWQVHLPRVTPACRWPRSRLKAEAEMRLPLPAGRPCPGRQGLGRPVLLPDPEGSSGVVSGQSVWAESFRVRPPGVSTPTALLDDNLAILIGSGGRARTWWPKNTQEGDLQLRQASNAEVGLGTPCTDPAGEQGTVPRTHTDTSGQQRVAGPRAQRESFSSPRGLVSSADDERGRASRAGHLAMSTLGAACRAPPARTATVCQSLLKTREMPEIDGGAEAEATVVLGPR